MAAGRTLASYVTDLYFLPAKVNIDVPNNLFALATLKWTAATAGAPRRPARFTPRHAVGVNAASGKHARVIIADPTADLWTGVATTWASIDNAGASVTYTVTGLVGEKASV
jgi:hypothetical protein